jgi:hypothetical protein
VDQPVDRHLGDAHDGSDFRDGQERNLVQGAGLHNLID